MKYCIFEYFMNVQNNPIKIKYNNYSISNFITF